MNYLGEHLFPGQLGHFLLVLSIVASLVATIAYFKAVKAKAPELETSWKKMARIAYLINAICVVSVFLIIHYVITHHYFEYHYAWNHSDKSLSPYYLISSIWEGQEGSFLLWAFWQGVLGIVLIRTSGKWEAPVMTVMSFTQICLATMVLGVYVFNIKVGSNPFLLTRQVFQDAPIFNRPNYLSLASMQDGNGLNQLLQNYWMVIHPPILFLGYASTIVPFAFAIAGLWKNEHTGWTKMVVPWALFSAAILGLGIMMGARWAYESLSFGGFWAWDPVENASLVPWLVLVGGIHTMLIYNSTGHSLRPTYFFFISAFILVLYATYLTRSGDLQDTSVHAFTGSGLNWQLRLYVAAFLPSYILYITRYKKIPFIAKEESNYSREFWMFIGSLVLFLSAMFIIVFTSLPLINKIFGSSYTVGSEVEFFYNRIQIFVAIVLGVLTAVVQFLRYKNTNKLQFWKRLIVPSVISLAISSVVSIWGNIDYNHFGAGFLAAIHVGIFAAVYAAVANTNYIWSGLNGKLKAAGASVGHLGFGILIAGILVASSKQEILSINTVNPLNFAPESKQKGTENLTLFKGIRTDMGKYWATYKEDSVGGNKTYFHIQMQNKKDGKAFVLKPDLIKNTKGQEGMSANPDAEHYWNKDIFSYISYAEAVQDDTTQFKQTLMKMGDTLYYSTGLIVLNDVVSNPNNGTYNFAPTDTAIMAEISVINSDGRTYKAKPVFYYKNGQPSYAIDTVFSQGLAIGLSGIDGNNRFLVNVKESSSLTPFIALKVLQFPFINLVWLGTIVMVTGFVMSVVRRVKLLKGSRA